MPVAINQVYVNTQFFTCVCTFVHKHHARVVNITSTRCYVQLTRFRTFDRTFTSARQTLSHQLVRNLSALREKDPETAGLITEQILDNALLSAGLLDEPQRIIERTQKLMEKLSA